MVPPPLACVIAVGAGVAAAGRWRRARKLRHIPIARHTYPLIGRVGTIPAIKAGKIHDVWGELASEADERGAGMLQLRVPGLAGVVLLDPQAVHAVTKRQQWIPRHRPFYLPFHWLGWRTDSMVETRDQAEHAATRKSLMPFFRSDNMRNVVHQLADTVAASCSQLEAKARVATDLSVTVDMVGVAFGIIDQLVQKVFLQTDVQLDTAAFQDQVKLMGEMGSSPLQAQLMRLRLHPAYWRRYRPNVRSLRRSWEAMLTASYERPMEEESCAFWACFRCLLPDALTNVHSYEKAVTAISGIYFAGSETTVNAIAIILAVLAVHPPTMAQLEQELDDAGLLVTQERPDQRLPNMDDLDALPVLNAVFLEGLRLFPPAPNGTVRNLDRPLETGHGPLPKGTTLFIPPWGIHRSAMAWGADARAWRPARWLEGRSTNAVKKDASGTTRWLPFSDGAQNCIGQHLATLETKVALAIFVARFRVHPSPGLPCACVRDVELFTTTFLTMHQARGVELRLQLRT